MVMRALLWLGAVVVGVLAVVVLWCQERTRPRYVLEERELWYVADTASGRRERFGSLMDEATLDLTVVVPAYNEELRIARMLDEAAEYLATRGPDFAWEMIVVDDGSRDRTAEVVHEYAQRRGLPVRVMRLVQNRGKGGSVRCGCLAAQGKLVLMADADGATRFSDLARLEAALLPPRGLAVGSRAHVVSEAVARRTALRNVLMWVFHWVVRWVGVAGVRDTQCGFKLFSRAAARLIFPVLHVERWAFDVEMLWIAQGLELPVAEVPVNWQEIDGSKLNPLTASVEMLLDMVRCKLAYMLGIWRLWR
jgi:dolichyl-phosphate beta-glucosyltransferase